VSLRGQRVRLVPVDPEHAAELFAAGHDGGDPALWEYLPYGPFSGVEEMRLWIGACAQSEDPQFFTILDSATGRALGMASYLRFAPDHRVVEIGHIWFGSALQRTPAATEAIYLLSRHAFEELHVRRLEWKCDAANERSRRAADRFGFTFEGVFRQHMLVKDRNRDTAWYSLLDGEWPEVRAAFDAWLDEGNFDEDGRQKRSLAELRAGS
jgi:RimJ/RimL family protein N-acetyltransferase